MIIEKKKWPKGAKIMAGGIFFPEYSTKGSVNFMKGCAVIGFFHIHTRTFHVIGEKEFDTIIPTSTQQEMVNFLKESPVQSFYCGQSKDIIKQYRKEINFSSGLAGVDTRIIRYDSLENTQNRFQIWSKLQQETLKYISNGVIHKGINQLSVGKSDFPASMRAVVSLLTGLERKLYNSDEFDHVF